MSVKKILHLLSIAIFLCGCGGDYSEDLGENYRFMETNADNHVIVKMLSEYNNRIKIHSNVRDYAYDDNYIVGYRAQSESPEAQYESALKQKFGYFILRLNYH